MFILALILILNLPLLAVSRLYAQWIVIIHLAEIESCLQPQIKELGATNGSDHKFSVMNGILKQPFEKIVKYDPWNSII